MSPTIEKVFLFDMQWTDDADYEYIFEDRLHDTMIHLHLVTKQRFPKK